MSFGAKLKRKQEPEPAQELPCALELEQEPELASLREQVPPPALVRASSVLLHEQVPPLAQERTSSQEQALLISLVQKYLEEVQPY